MSIEVSKFYWDRYAGVKGSERLVILALADYCNEAGWCFPSVPELARRCLLSDRGTQKILGRLVAGGHIAVAANEGRRKKCGSPTHKYHLLAYQRSLGNENGEPIHSPLVVDKGEQVCSLNVADKGEQIHTPFVADKGEPIHSPFAVDNGEPMRSPFVASKGEQIDGKGEQIDGKGEQVSSPDPYRSTNDPNTNSAARARPPAELQGVSPQGVSLSDYQKVVAAYHDVIGTLTPVVEEEIKKELACSSAEWVIQAIGIAAMRGKPRWAYVAGILRRWHADGFDGGYDGGAEPRATRVGNSTGSKSVGYGRQWPPATSAKRQSIEDYADDPEYYAQLRALYAGVAVMPDAPP